jgi:small-conductance mechanosensitive channel
MSFERPLPGAGIGAEPAPVPVTNAAEPATDGVPPAMRLQILSTEHWSLLASRSLAWNESFSRAGMFLSTLSGAIVALALVAQASDFGEGFRLFALVILPVVLLVGIGTVLRMGISNYHDALCVVGMNRIRAAYMELAPDLKQYFVMGTTDDERGLELTMAAQPRTSMPVQMIASTPMLVTVIDAILVAAILALLALQLGTTTVPALVLGFVGFIATLGAFFWYAGRDIARAMAEYKPLFPTP